MTLDFRVEAADFRIGLYDVADTDDPGRGGFFDDYFEGCAFTSNFFNHVFDRSQAAALLFDFGFLFGTAKTEHSLQLKFVDAFVDQSCDLIEGEAEFFEDEDAIEAREL